MLTKAILVLACAMVAYAGDGDVDGDVGVEVWDGESKKKAFIVFLLIIRFA